MNSDKIKFVSHALSKAGYKKIGAGLDAMVWTKDAGTVSKIIVPANQQDNIESFVSFYKVCMKNSHLPTLPKFYEVEGEPYLRFSLSGAKFAQFNMEKLKKIPTNSIDEFVVWLMSDLAMKSIDWSKAQKSLFDPDSYIGENGEAIVNKLKKIGKERLDYYRLLYNTMIKLRRKSKKLGYDWDLHTENVMMRSNGDLVITDPWMS